MLIKASSKRFRRATHFKVYLTNPSIRSALFSPISEQDEAIGYLVETSIFSQWFHSPSYAKLHYARWNKGEVDIVSVNEKNQKPRWIVEAKWSDAPYKDDRKLKNIIDFSHIHNLTEASVTTKTINDTRLIKGINIRFVPASIYCYILGRNIVHGKLMRSQTIGKK